MASSSTTLSLTTPASLVALTPHTIAAITLGVGHGFYSACLELDLIIGDVGIPKFVGGLILDRKREVREERRLFSQIR